MNVVIILIAVVAVTAGGWFWWQNDARRYPWASESAGRPALVGSWVGQVRTASGGKRGVLLLLALPDRASNARDQQRPFGALAGSGKNCDEAGTVRTFTVTGAPDNRDGTRLHLEMAPVETPSPHGLSLSTASGMWDQANVLHLDAHFSFSRDGQLVTGAENPDTQKGTTLHMERGADPEFQRVCASLRQ